MTANIENDYNGLLEKIAENLDISPTKYKEAVDRYNAVGAWLNQGLPSDISPQGSFRLGTVTRPLRDNKDVDYDIDLVCQLPVDKEAHPPYAVKQVVGNRLKENKTYERMLDTEGKRCWTLNYTEADGIGFHMDILPSTPEDEAVIRELKRNGVDSSAADKAIAITNKKDNRYSYLSSNPNGYAQWFDSVKQPAFDMLERRQKQMIFESNEAVFANVEDVPDALVKTPLQMAIQILKRHRDIRFSGHELEDMKPISMIITTLSARFYNSEHDLYNTLKHIIDQLKVQSQLINPGFVFENAKNNLPFMKRQPDGTWYIPNPVNPSENFADRWHEDGNKCARAFFMWVSWVYSDLVDVFNGSGIRDIVRSLENVFGGKIMEKVSKGIYFAGAPAIMRPTQTERHHVEIKDPPKPWGKI